MLKKICLLALLMLPIAVKSGMPEYGMASTSGTQSQIDHIKSQMTTIKRAWDSARIRIKLAEKASPQLYQTIKVTFDKILSSNAFAAKLDGLVSNQFDAIVQNSMPFSDTTTELDISVVYPNVTMNDFGKQLFSVMANKAYCFELGQRLKQKIQELQAASSFTSKL